MTAVKSHLITKKQSSLPRGFDNDNKITKTFVYLSKKANVNPKLEIQKSI